jgi:hypothetical protein
VRNIADALGYSLGKTAYLILRGAFPVIRLSHNVFTTPTILQHYKEGRFKDGW